MAYLYVALSGILFGGIVFFGKILADVGVSMQELLLLPNMIGLIAMSFFIYKDIPKFRGLSARFMLLFMSALFFVMIGQFVPLFLNISVTTVLILLYMQPVWTLLIERFYYHRIIPRRRWILAEVMILGLIVLLNPFQPQHLNAVGVLLALLGGVGLSLWVIMTQKISMLKISPAGNYWLCCLASLLPLLIFWQLLKAFGAPVETTSFTFHLSKDVWKMMLIYSLLIVTVPELLLFLYNDRLPAEQIGMLLLLEPAVGITLDTVYLGTPLTWNIIVGAVMIFGANIFLIIKGRPSSE